MFVQGVDIDRSKNESNQDYLHSETANNKGVSSYIHKYLMGMQQYYFLRDHKDLRSKMDPEFARKNPEESYLSQQ